MAFVGNDCGGLTCDLFSSGEAASSVPGTGGGGGAGCARCGGGTTGGIGTIEGIPGWGTGAGTLGACMDMRPSFGGPGGSVSGCAGNIIGGGGAPGGIKWGMNAHTHCQRPITPSGPNPDMDLPTLPGFFRIESQRS